MSRMPKATDAQVRENMETQFFILTGERKPTPKKWEMSEKDKRKWFDQQIFLHFIAFRLFFNDAKKRNLLNPVEIEIGEWIIATAFS